MTHMKKVFSFVKLFEHNSLANIKLTELYQQLDTIRITHASENSGDDVAYTRIDVENSMTHTPSLVVAYRQNDHQMWVASYPDGMTSNTYEWRTQLHSVTGTKWWDMTATAPEFEAGLSSSGSYYSSDTLRIYPELLAIAFTLIGNKTVFLKALNSAIVEVDDVYDVYLQTYNGDIDSKRLGQFAFINGQQNGKLLYAAKRAIKNLDNQKRDAHVHLLPHLGSLIPNTSFDELSDLLEFIESDCHLTGYHYYTLSTSRAERLTRILAHIKRRGEKRLKELMSKHTQTVSLHQLSHDETIQEQIENGAQVNLLLELNEMKWVD